MTTPFRLAACLMAIAAAATALAARSASGTITLARRGEEPAYRIVLPEGAPMGVTFACGQLEKYVRQMTDVELPTVDPAGAKGHPKIVLRVRKGLGHDTFRFGVVRGNLVIEGDDERAVVFAVFDLLENQFGCEWLTPEQEIVPKKNELTLPDNFKLLRKPVFECREATFTDTMRQDFAAKLHLNGYAHQYDYEYGGKSRFRMDGLLGKCHTFQKILPVEDNFAEHPEWYCEIDGKRFKGNEVGRTQLCLTNPEVLKRVTQYVLDRIEENYPDTKVFGLSQSDCWLYCQCKNCAAIDQREGSHAGTNIDFVNKVADAVKEKYPEAIIETLAYEFTRQPPKNLKPRDNVMICLCTDTCDFSKPIVESRFRHRGANPFQNDLKKWCEISKHVYIWDYPMNFHWKLTAFPNVYSLKANLELFANCGVTEVFEEGDRPCEHQAGVALKQYLIGHLLWDPKQPLKPLLDRFYAGYYGAAAPLMRKYMEEMHKVSRNRNEVACPMMMWGVINSPALPTDMFESLGRHLRRAAEAVKDDPVRLRNVQWEMNSNDYTLIMRSDKPTAALKAAARRILKDWEEFPQAGIVSEDSDVNRQSREKIAAYAK